MRIAFVQLPDSTPGMGRHAVLQDIKERESPSGKQDGLRHGEFMTVVCVVQPLFGGPDTGIPDVMIVIMRIQVDHNAVIIKDVASVEFVPRHSV